jgi:hypothetical protein
MSDSLRAIVAHSQSIIDQLAETDGELTPEMEAQLAQIDVKLPAKIDSYAHIMDRLENEEQYWKAKASQFNAVAKGLANTRARIKEALKDTMSIMGVDEIKGNDVRFKLSNAKPRLYLDESKIVDEYMQETIIREPNKVKIELDLKAGKEVPGAQFLESKSLRSYANRKAGD